MRIPIAEVTDYLDTKEMYEITQSKLNEGDEVVHAIIGTSIKDVPVEVIAYLDSELQVKWEVYLNFILVISNVEAKNLLAEILYAIKYYD